MKKSLKLTLPPASVIRPMLMFGGSPFVEPPGRIAVRLPRAAAGSCPVGCPSGALDSNGCCVDGAAAGCPGAVRVPSARVVESAAAPGRVSRFYTFSVPSALRIRRE
jgi:hypothetical protein